MSFDSILTFIGIIIAVLALIPKYKLLYLRFKINWIDIVIVVFCFSIIHYLLFFNTFNIFHITPGFNLHRWGITPKNSIYITLLLLTAYLFIRINYFPFPIRKIKRFGQLIDNLIQENKLNDLITLLDKNYGRLEKISRGKTRYFILIEKIKSKALFLSKIFPSYEEQKSEAFEILLRITLNDKFIEHVVKSNSYVFLNFLPIEQRHENDVIDLILNKLLIDNQSIIFIELENTQNVSDYCNYDIPEKNKLLFYLFNDPKIGEKLGVWRPVGEYVIERLDYLRRHPELDEYNTSIQNFYESTKWKSDIFVSIHFFNIMVSKALYKGICWHMWLPYYRHFIEGMIKNHNNNDPFYNEFDEWPTKYEYMIYSIFSNMRSWIRSLEYLDLSKENIKLNDRSWDNNGNIPVATMRVAGHCLKILHSSTTISDRFKRYIFEIYLNLYFDLRANDSLFEYSKLLAKAILSKRDYSSENLNLYYDFIDDMFHNHFDKIPIRHEYVDEFKEILRSRGNFL